MTNEIANVANGTATYWSSWIQLGFGGFTLILLSFIGWLVRALIRQARETTAATVQHAVAMQANTDVTRELSGAVRSLSDRLGSAPCAYAVGRPLGQKQPSMQAT